MNHVKSLFMCRIPFNRAILCSSYAVKTRQGATEVHVHGTAHAGRSLPEQRSAHSVAGSKLGEGPRAQVRSKSGTQEDSSQWYSCNSSESTF